MNNVIELSTGFSSAQAERGKFTSINNSFLISQGYPVSGTEGRWAVLTYDIGVAASAPISLTSSIISPIAGGSKSIMISGGAVSLATAMTFDPNTKLVRISFTGPGDVNITYDGSVPTSGIGGEIWFKGGLLEINLSTAQAIQAIKAGSSNGSMYVTQFA